MTNNSTTQVLYFELTWPSAAQAISAAIHNWAKCNNVSIKSINHKYDAEAIVCKLFVEFVNESALTLFAIKHPDSWFTYKNGVFNDSSEFRIQHKNDIAYYSVY